MRLITNDKLIARQSKIARYATFGALAILLGSLVTSFNTAYIVLAYGTLFVGMALAYVGSSLGYKWVKEPRADQALAKALKGFDNKHHSQTAGGRARGRGDVCSAEWDKARLAIRSRNSTRKLKSWKNFSRRNYRMHR
jgi:hypothetical protein